MNINEIAKMAGVSRATVSRYLNAGYVSQEKKERIAQVIRETGYQPSSHAQTMRTKKTKVIGVILPKISSETIGKMVSGISHVLTEKGYQLLLADTENHEENEVQYLELFRKNYVDGVIFIGTIFTEEHRRKLEMLTVPIVILGQKLSGYNCIYYNDYEASRDMTRLLLQNAGKIGYLGVTVRDEAVGRRRMEGFLDACREKGIEGLCIPEGEFHMDSGFRQMELLLEQDPEVDSVFCATDSIAMGALLCLRERGIAVPQKVQIAGVGDSSLARAAYPKITTIHYSYTSSGIEAAKRLLQMLEGDQEIRCRRMDYRLVEQESKR